MKTHTARMAKMLPPSCVRAPPALCSVLLRAIRQQGFRSQGWQQAQAPKPSSCRILVQDSARSQPLHGPWSSNSSFGLLTAIPRNLDYLVSSMPCTGAPPLAEGPQVRWYMQQICVVVQGPSFACQNHRIFPACKHCSRHLRLLGTVCLMLLQPLIKWNKCHHSPLKRSVPLFFQNMSAGCWQIPDVAALILDQRRPCWIAVKSHLQHLLSWHSLHSWQTLFLSQLHLGDEKEFLVSMSKSITLEQNQPFPRVPE